MDPERVFFESAFVSTFVLGRLVSGEEKTFFLLVLFPARILSLCLRLVPTTQVRWLLDYLAPATTVELYDAPLGLGMSFFLSHANAAKVVSLHGRSARGSKRALRV